MGIIIMSDIRLTTFTDPMMGLSYESEPMYRKLETHFANKITLNYKMALLVRNVYDLVNEEDLKVSNEYAISNYNKGLAKIYKSEEMISNMPINMTNFNLFSVENISSYPLNLAYKAVEIIDKSVAERFLYNLRFATIVECKKTLDFNVILDVVKDTGIDKNKFIEMYHSSKVKKLLDYDYLIAKNLNIRLLPAYCLQIGNRNVLIKKLIDYDGIVDLISKMSNKKVKPNIVHFTLDDFKILLNKHPIISPIEVMEAYDFRSIDDVKKNIGPMIVNNEIEIKEVHNGWFIYKK